MNYMKPVFLMLLVVGSCAAEDTPDIQHDLDGDGVPDIVSIESLVHEDHSVTEKIISIEFSAGGESLVGKLVSDAGHLAVYPGRVGEMIVDRSNRNSRESAEMSYDVYQWKEDKNGLCLHSHIYGASPNELRGEFAPEQIDIELFGGCIPPGGDAMALEVPLVPLVTQDARLRALDGIQLPEWVAVELAAQASDSAADELLLLAADQIRQHNHRASAIILNGMIKRSIRLEEACSTLNDVYKKAGYSAPRDDCRR